MPFAALEGGGVHKTFQGALRSATARLGHIPKGGSVTIYEIRPVATLGGRKGWENKEKRATVARRRTK